MGAGGGAEAESPKRRPPCALRCWSRDQESEAHCPAPSRTPSFIGSLDYSCPGPGGHPYTPWTGGGVRSRQQVPLGGVGASPCPPRGLGRMLVQRRRGACASSRGDTALHPWGSGPQHLFPLPAASQEARAALVLLPSGETPGTGRVLGRGALSRPFLLGQARGGHAAVRRPGSSRRGHRGEPAVSCTLGGYLQIAASAT